MDRNIGVELEETRLNHIAYADDVVLLAGTASGLQCLNTFGDNAMKANLEINLDKTMVAAITAHGRIKVVSIGKPIIKYKNKTLATMELNTNIKYLGIHFNPYGIVRVDLVNELNGMLEKLRKSFLKPQQRLWVLKNCFSQACTQDPLYRSECGPAKST